MPAAHKITVADLADLPSFKKGYGNHPFLYCETCNAQHSAHKGDYFQLPSEHVFTHCGKPMRLVRKETRFVDVKIKRAK